VAEFALAASVVVPERAAAGCALATGPRGGPAHLAWTGSDFRINLATSADGARLDGKKTFRHRTATTVSTSTYEASQQRSVSSTKAVALCPAVAVTNRGVHLAWTGTDARLNLWPLGPADEPTRLRERSDRCPALAAWGDELVVGWTGTDQRLNLLYTSAGSLTSPALLDQRSNNAPALCTVGPDVVVAWAGTDRRLNVLWSRGGGFGPPLRLAQTSDHAPALSPLPGATGGGGGPYGGREAGARGGVLLAWTGRDRRVNVVPLGPGAGPGTGPTAGPPIRLEARSDHAPALCPFGAGTLLAWTGGDARPNLAHLHRP